MMIICRIPKLMLLSANGREHRQQRARTTKLLREAAFWNARQAHEPVHEGTVHLSVTVYWPALKRRRDRINLAPTSKACLDGIVDAGRIRDDSDDVILSETWTTAESVCDKQYGAILRYEFTDGPWAVAA